MTPSDRFFRKVAKKVELEIHKCFPNIALAGTGGAMRDGELEYNSIVFEFHGLITPDQGAAIIFDIVDTYIKCLYGQSSIRKYLQAHPFDHTKLEVVVLIFDEAGMGARHPHIKSVALRKGQLRYRSVSESEQGIFNTESAWEEHYEDAAKRLGLWPPVGPKALEEE